MIGNISCAGHQIDAIFVSSGKIIVIDFKNYGGKLEFSENNPWRIFNGADFVFVSGGGGIRNPFQQVNAYRHALRQYLLNAQGQILSPNHGNCNWGHLNAIVLFHQAVQFDVQSIPQKIRTYFSIADYSRIYQRIEDSFSNELVLDDNEIEKILRTFSLSDENLFDESNIPEPSVPPVDVTALERLELIRKLAPALGNASDTTRLLNYYHTLVNLERFKEPKALNAHTFPIRWGEVQDEIIIDVESVPAFNQHYQQNLHEQFKKNILVCINVMLSNVNVSLFQTVLLIGDITDHRRIQVNLSDFSLNTSALESRNLAENDIEELTSLVNSATSFSEKISAVRKYLEVVVELVSSVTVAFSEESIFTSQLLAELSSLKRIGVKDQSLLYNYLLGIPVKRALLPSIEPILQITPLNLSQRRAVELAFTQSLSVVTGPPGTGKTQVVLNILANGVAQRKKILFASRNNRAVDNVREKLAAILQEPNFFLRFGTKTEVRERTKAVLQQMSNRITHGLIPENSDDLDAELTKYSEIDKKRTEHLNRLRAVKPAEKKLRTENESLAKEKVFLDAWTSDNKIYFSIDEKLLNEIEKKVHDQLAELSSIKGVISKLIFAIFKKQSYLANQKKLAVSLPQLIFSLNNHAGTKPVDLSTLQAWYEALSQTLKKIFDVRHDLNLKNQMISRREHYVSQLKEEYDGLVESIPEDRKGYQEAESKLPGLGVNVLNSLCLNRLSECGSDVIERYLGYVPDNIPWKDQEIPKFTQTVNSLLNTFSAISVTSLSIKNGFPLAEEMFDLVVIDEASQCDIASAIPLIYRAKQLVVIGDPLQLKHISKVEKFEEKYLRDTLGLSEYQLNYVENSLYDHCDQLAKLSKADSVLLIDHYRCHPEIINYSNEIFYKVKFGQELNIKTDLSRLTINPQGLFWVDTFGNQHAERNTNRAEIEKCIAIATGLAQKHPNISIGITTPFRHQANEIKELIPEQIRNRVTADTVHRYQGDEKDIMILSLVVTGNSSPGKVNWINTKVPYLINVAVTRARNTLYVVGNAGYCLELPGTSPLGHLARYVKSLGKIKQ